MPPPRLSPAVEPAPAVAQPASAADFDNPEEQTRVAAPPTGEDRASDFDATATVVGRRPTAAELAELGLPELDQHGAVVGRVTSATLPSMQSVVPPSKRRSPQVDVVEAGATDRAEVAPRPAGAAAKDDEPPSTKPTTSRRRLSAPGAPRSSSRPVLFDEQLRRALARVESQIHVPPELEERWFARLAALRNELKLGESGEPTDEQVGVMIRELHHAEVDAREARLEAPASSSLSAVARRIAAASRGLDADGEETLLRRGPETDEDADDAGRPTGEEFTRVFSRDPDEADAQTPGVPVAPKPAVRQPPPPQIGDVRGATGRRRLEGAQSGAGEGGEVL